MFKKKECNKCRKRINNDYEFCPYCGNSLNENFKEDWGMLGRDDFTGQFNSSNSFFGKITGGMMGKMINNAMRMLEKEMQKEGAGGKFKLMINGREIPLGSNRKNPKKIKKIETKKLPMFSEEKRKQFQRLKREEPKANLTRFADKIIYEIEIPGLNSLDDLSILKLENSIEVKAIGHEKAYEKIIQINSPIIDYSILNNNLILEFGVR